jgi:hypothetical protein
MDGDVAWAEARLSANSASSSGRAAGFAEPLASGRSRGLPPEASSVALLGVDYTHLKTTDDGDLYLTEHGRPFWEHLLPENWYARDWFVPNRERLIGTSVIYKVPTKPVNGVMLRLVAKWSRVGEAVPLDTLTINRFINAEFNSPFEEFALVMELRARDGGPPSRRVRLQKPLAIYVPSERLQLWQTGRSATKIAAKLAKSPGVELDILRQYVVLYGWIKGVDLLRAADRLQLAGEQRAELFTRATSLANHELERKGYRVVDMKPAHLIVRFRPDGSLLRDRQGQLAYALVDYELLARTPEHEQAVLKSNRQRYLQHMARRFELASGKTLPAHLKPVNLLGVDYIFGHAESTGGLLWVVGNDPDLFNYFLPERWRRTRQTRLSAKNQVFYTRTKDNINLVWRVSRVGEMPSAAVFSERAPAIQGYGYNSPFEEFAHALKLSRSKVNTVYPRAIYMTGHKRDAAREITDPRRYAALARLLTPDGEPALRMDYDYITIWGFWNGPDEWLAERDGQYYRAVNAEEACKRGDISQTTLAELLKRTHRRLARSGYEALNLEPHHLLLSFDASDKMVLDTLGRPQVRLCNFELVRRRRA